MALKLTSMLAGVMLLASTAAHATTFTFDNVTFDTDGMITGSFAFDGTNVTNATVTVSSVTNPAFDGSYNAGSFFIKGVLGVFNFDNGVIDTLLTVVTPVSFSTSNPLSGSVSTDTPPQTSFADVSGSLVPSTPLQTSFADVSGSLVPSTPLPAALPLFATGIGGLGLLGWRRKRKAQAVA
jgi:hypothetical protein